MSKVELVIEAAAGEFYDGPRNVEKLFAVGRKPRRKTGSKTRSPTKKVCRETGDTDAL